MGERYVLPYVPGAVTTKGYIVICVPGMPAVEVTEVLGNKLKDMIIAKQVVQAQELLMWFSNMERPDVTE